MEANLEVNPADIRFTQDSISLYFQFPYDRFSVREAVRKLSRNEMRPDDFPPIRVNSSGGCLWSIDNRRLWVFRLARCSSINVNLVKKMHPRVKDVLSDEDLQSMMQMEDFFPRLRDRGKKDLKFDQQFPQPVSSLQVPVREALEKPLINVASNVWSRIRNAVWSNCLKIFAVARRAAAAVASNVERRIRNIGRRIRNAVWSVFCKIFSVARRAATAVASDVGRRIRNAVGSKFRTIFSVANRGATAVASDVGRRIRNAAGSVFRKVIPVARKAAAAVARTITWLVGLEV